jgi:hypothetical protein
MSKLDKIAEKIIKEQERIIGPIAWQEASEVRGIRIIEQNGGEVSMDDDTAKDAVDALIGKYEHLFGRASREVCKEAVMNLISDIPPGDLPSSLR